MIFKGAVCVVPELAWEMSVRHRPSTIALTDLMRKAVAIGRVDFVSCGEAEVVLDGKRLHGIGDPAEPKQETKKAALVPK
jgi:hypothetical protein